MDQVRRRKIRIIDNLFVMNLLKSGDLRTGGEVKIIGALCMDIKKKCAITLKANYVILAAGDIHEYTLQVVPGFLKIMEKVLPLHMTQVQT